MSVVSAEITMIKGDDNSWHDVLDSIYVTEEEGHIVVSAHTMSITLDVNPERPTVFGGCYKLNGKDMVVSFYKEMDLLIYSEFDDVE